LKYWDAISIFNLIAIFSKNHMPLFRVIHIFLTQTSISFLPMFLALPREQETYIIFKVYVVNEIAKHQNNP
jgi:hypothetical protein